MTCVCGGALGGPQGLGAGFVAVCVGSPVDVVKSRVMGSKGQYTGMLDCFVKTFQKEGLPGFYKGFLPNFARLGSWNVVMFLSLEQARARGGGGGGTRRRPSHPALRCAADTRAAAAAARQVRAAYLRSIA